jgi:sugar phosphate isomerase/epimerase
MLEMARFAMNTNTLAGTLEEKLRAVKGAGFGAIVLSGGDLVSHPDGLDVAVELVNNSGLKVSAFQMLHDFEGLSGHMLDYKIDVARALFDMMRSVDAPLLIVASTTSPHASGNPDKIAADLAMLGALAVPPGIRIAYGALAWGRWINEYTAAWDVVRLAGQHNVGLAIDSFHVLARGTSREHFGAIPGERIFLVQLADYLWDMDDLIETARHRRVFPSEGNHSAAIVDLVERIERTGYGGDYSFDVVNDDYAHLPAGAVAARGRKAGLWLGVKTPAPEAPH